MGQFNGSLPLKMSLESSLWSRTSDFRIQGSCPWSLTRGRASQFFSLTRVIKKMPDPALTLCLLPISHNCTVTICSGSVDVSKNFGSTDDCNNYWPPNLHCLQPGGVSFIQPLVSFSLAQTAKWCCPSGVLWQEMSLWVLQGLCDSKWGQLQPELQTCPSAPRQPAYPGTTPDAFTARFSQISRCSLDPPQLSFTISGPSTSLYFQVNKLHLFPSKARQGLPLGTTSYSILATLQILQYFSARSP